MVAGLSASGLSATTLDLNGLDLAILGQDPDVVDLAIAVHPGLGTDDFSLVLPFHHFHGLGQRWAVALGDRQITRAPVVGDRDRQNLPELVPNIQFAGQGLGGGPKSQREQQYFRQMSHHDFYESGFNLVQHAIIQTTEADCNGAGHNDRLVATL
jgi:hypothetical protein